MVWNSCLIFLLIESIHGLSPSERLGVDQLSKYCPVESKHGLSPGIDSNILVMVLLIESINGLPPFERSGMEQFSYVLSC